MKNNGFFHFLALAAYLFAAGASAVMTLQWNEDAGSSVGLAVGAGVFFGLGPRDAPPRRLWLT